MTKSFIDNKLLEIGLPAGCQGFEYISQAIMMLEDGLYPNVKITWMYHMIGKKNGTSGSCVERSIRHAFYTIRKNTSNISKVEHYIGMKNPQNQNSLFQLYVVLKDEYETSLIMKEDMTKMREFIIKLADQYGLKISVLN